MNTYVKSIVILASVFGISTCNIPSLIAKGAPQADLRDVAMMVLGNRICHSVSLERVAQIARDVALRDGIPFKEATNLIRRVYNELILEAQKDPDKLIAMCQLTRIMDKQIP